MNKIEYQLEHSWCGGGAKSNVFPKFWVCFLLTIQYMKVRFRMINTAVIGVGNITKGIIKNIIENENLKLFIYSRHLKNYLGQHCHDKLERLSNINMDVIITCFSNDDDAKILCQELLHNNLISMGTLVIDLTTSTVQAIHNRRKQIENVGGKYIECPVTGSREGSERGELSLFVCMPELNTSEKSNVDLIFGLMSNKIYVFSESGGPSKFKLLYNVWGAAILLTLKAFNPLNFDFNTKDSELACEIVKEDGWMSAVCQSKLDQVNKKEFEDVHFRLELMVKDLLYAQKSIIDLNENDFFEFILTQYKESNKINLLRKLDFSIIARKVDELHEYFS